MSKLGLCGHSLDYALGEIRDELLKKRFEHHIPSCLSCQEDIVEYRDILKALQTKQSDVQTSTTNSQVIPYSTLRSRKPSRRLLGPFGIKSRALSLSLSLAVTALMLLMHAGHFAHITAIGDSAIDHVTVSVIHDSQHIRTDLRRI